MANWLNISDFVDDIQLSSSSIAAVNTAFDNTLGRFQVEFLRTVLGAKMYNDLLTGLVVTPTPDAKWTNIQNGCDFIYSDNETYHLAGLKEALKQFSYARYQQVISTVATVQSNVIKKSEIAIVVEPTGKVVKAINTCIDMIEELKLYIDWKVDDYPDFIYASPFSNRANHFGI